MFHANTCSKVNHTTGRQSLSKYSKMEIITKYSNHMTNSKRKHRKYMWRWDEWVIREMKKEIPRTE